MEEIKHNSLGLCILSISQKESTYAICDKGMHDTIPTDWNSFERAVVYF